MSKRVGAGQSDQDSPDTRRQKVAVLFPLALIGSPGVEFWPVGRLSFAQS